MSKPSWAKTFPRLYDLYSGSNANDPNNYFETSLVRSALAGKKTGLVEIESDLQQMDGAAWREFKSRTIHYVTAIDKRWGWHTQLFDCFNEAKGYAFLKKQKYKGIHFISEVPGKKTPDLLGKRNDGAVLLEAKIVHESDDANDYMTSTGKYKVQKDAQAVQHYLNNKMQQKLKSTIQQATSQLAFKYPDPAVCVKRRILFLAVWFDPPSATRRSRKELAQFLREKRPKNVEIKHHVKNPFLY